VRPRVCNWLMTGVLHVLVNVVLTQLSEHLARICTSVDVDANKILLCSSAIITLDVTIYLFVSEFS
jgi:hypothetical protein